MFTIRFLANAIKNSTAFLYSVFFIFKTLPQNSKAGRFCSLSYRTPRFQKRKHPNGENIVRFGTNRDSLQRNTQLNSKISCIQKCSPPLTFCQKQCKTQFALQIHEVFVFGCRLAKMCWKSSL